MATAATAKRVRSELHLAERIIVKLGTNVVTHDGRRLAMGRLFGILEEIAELQQAGKQVVLVSSGAVGMGMQALGLTQKPESLGRVQACAAVGQGLLMGVYTQAFTQLGVPTAQVLLSTEDLADHGRALAVRTTLMRLLDFGVVPVLNENDSVSVQELIEDSSKSFGDNDGLSARTAVSLNADLLVLLTNVDGLLSGNPAEDQAATRIPFLADIDDDVIALASGKSSGGRGGMQSKLAAAQLAVEGGVTVAIAPGAAVGVLTKLLAGDDVGTLVAPHHRRPARVRRIAITSSAAGAVIVNAGALRALYQESASLLPIGVMGVEGSFDRGDLVEVRDDLGRVHGRGLVNYDGDECRAIAGHHSSEIESKIGWRGYNAMITRLNLVMEGGSTAPNSTSTEENP